MVKLSSEVPKNYLLGESGVNSADDGANGGTDATEADGGKETLESGVNLDEQDGNLVLGLNGDEGGAGDLRDLGLEARDGGGHGDDISEGTGDGGEIKAADETEDCRLELNKEVLAAGETAQIGDGENAGERIITLDIADKTLNGAEGRGDNVLALDVTSDRLKATNDRTDKATNLTQTKSVEEVNNSLSQLNKNSVTVLEKGSDLGETRSAVVQLVNRLRSLDDLTNGLLESAERQLAHEALELGLSRHLDVRGSGLVKDCQDLAGAESLGHAGDGAGGGCCCCDRRGRGCCAGACGDHGDNRQWDA